MGSRVCIILITGPEGAGKTTSINIIARFLKKYGYMVISPYLRSTFLPVRILRRIFILLGRKQILQRPDGSLYIQPDNNILHRISNLWYMLDVIYIYTYILVLTIYILIINTLISKRIIILCERFIIDTVVDQLYGIIFYKPSHKVMRMSLYLLMKILNYVQLKYRFIIIELDADINEILRRFFNRGYSDFIEFIYFQKKMLPKIINIVTSMNTANEFLYIDNTHLTVADTATIILNEIKRNKCIIYN